MGNKVSGVMSALAVVSTDLAPDALTAQGTSHGSAGVDSEYSEAGPQPGDATTSNTAAALQPRISGGQTNGVELRVINGGHPERGNMGMLYRLATDTADTDWRSWSEPNLIQDWLPVVWSDTASYDRFDVVTLRDSQDLVVLYGRTDTADELKCTRLDWDGAEFGTAVTASVDARQSDGDVDATWEAVAGVELSDGRLLAIGFDANIYVFVSTDRGDTWALHSGPPSSLQYSGAPNKARAAEHRGDVAMVVTFSGTLHQWVSTDRGAQWREITTQATSLSADVISVNDQALIVGYIDSGGSSYPTVKVLASATQSIDDATAIQVGAVALDVMCLCSDGTGTVYLVGQEASTEHTVVWYSEDLGATWTQYDELLFATHDTSTYLRNFAATFVRGQMALAHNWTANPGNEDDSIGVVFAGGWGQFAQGYGEGSGEQRMGRCSWAHTGASAANGATGIPIELPADTGVWTNGGAGTFSLVSPGALQIACSAASGYFQRSTISGNDCTAKFEMRITSGTGSSTALNAGASLRQADGVDEYILEVRFDAANNRIRCWDQVAGTQVGSDITGLSLGSYLQVFAQVGSSGRCYVWVREPLSTVYTRGPWDEQLTSNTSTPAATHRVRIGVVTSSTTTVQLRQWHYAVHGVTTNNINGWRHGMDASPGAGRGTYHTGGAWVTSDPLALPDIGSATSAAFLSAVRGPGAQNESYTILPVHDHGVDKMLPWLHPSPDEGWRSTGVADAQYIVWDLGQQSQLGGRWHWTFGFQRPNVRTIYVETNATGAGAWSTLGTLDLATGFTGLGFTRTGDWIRPNTGTSDGARYIHAGELVGGFVILTSGVARRIVANSAGGWTDPSTNKTVLPEIRIEISGSEPSSGTCDIVWPNGVLCIRATGDTPTQYARYWRLRVPVQDTPDSYYGIGNFLPCTTQVFGKAWSRGWTERTEPNTARRTLRSGTVRARKLGRPATVWTQHWADGAIHGRTRWSGVDPDYLSAGTTSTPALAARDDVWRTLAGCLYETEGGEYPVIALRSVPGTSQTITDPTQFLMGMWDSSVQFNHVTGEPGVDEYGRLDPIRVVELV